MLSLFPRGVLDEILNLIESVSDGFPSYSFTIYDKLSLRYVRIYFYFLLLWQLKNYRAVRVEIIEKYYNMVAFLQRKDLKLFVSAIYYIYVK